MTLHLGAEHQFRLRLGDGALHLQVVVGDQGGEAVVSAAARTSRANSRL